MEANLQPGEAVYQVQSYEPACVHLLEQALNCTPEIWMQIDDTTLKKAERDKLFYLLPNYRIAELKVMVVGNMYKLMPAYKSCVRMLSYARGNRAVLLTPEEQQALKAAQAVLREVGVEGKTHAEIARALHDWIVLNCEYDIENADFERKYDKGYNPFDGKYLLLKHKGVCDSYVQAYWLMLQLAGVPCSMMSGNLLKDGQGHAWNLVHMGDHWAHVDATFDDPVPDRKGQVLHDNFDKTDAEMEKSRRWEKDVFPNAKGECFLLQKIKHFKRASELQTYLKGRKDGVCTVQVAALAAAVDPVPEVLAAAKKALPGVRITAVRDPFYPQAVRIRWGK